MRSRRRRSQRGAFRPWNQDFARRVNCFSIRCGVWPQHRLIPMETDVAVDYEQLCTLVSDMHDLKGLLNGLTELAASAMTQKACTRVECAVTLYRRRRAPTAAGSDREAMMLSGEGQRVEGPGSAALRTGEPAMVNNPSDIRWPMFARELSDSSFGSVLAIPLDLGPSGAAALNLFAVQPGAFTEEATHGAQDFADMAGRALRMGLRIVEAELKASDLAAAMTYRTAINMAQGIIMAQNRCSDQEAIAFLQNASSARNEKLHDVARAVVAGITDIAPDTHFED